MNYLKSHWRGEQSLVRSYWINGLLAGIIYYAIGNIANAAAEKASRSIAGLAGTVVILSIVFLLTALVYMWQAVGLWRSATNHIVKTGRAFWARIVKGTLVIGIVFNVINFGYSGVRITTLMKMLFGLDGLTTSVALGKDNELLVFDFITYKTSDKIQSFLNYNPTIKMVQFTSKGGYVDPALVIRDLIESHHLIAYVPNVCASACTIAFSGSPTRISSSDARFGFHHIKSMPGMSESFVIETEKDVKRDWIKRGIQEGFVAKAFTSDSSSLWIPTLKELADANFVTQVWDGKELWTARDYCRSFLCK